MSWCEKHGHGFAHGKNYCMACRDEENNTLVFIAALTPIFLCVGYGVWQLINWFVGI